MPTAEKSRRYIRLSIFSGILASAIFAEAKVFASPLTTYIDFYNAISNNLGGTHNLGANIAVPSITDPDRNTVFEGTFIGVLNGLKADGANYIISGLTRPLFDRIGEGAEVKNLELETNSVDGVTGAGALANTLETGATVNNVDVTGVITGSAEVGGLVGSSSGTITNSSMNGEVNGDFRVGGLVGVLSTGGTITGSQATGDVTGNGDRVGGLVGWADGNISSSSAEGNVSGGRWDVGGLVGYSSGDIANSHAIGDVVGRDRVGGLVGMSEGDITFSSAKGEVTSTAFNPDIFGDHGELAPGGANGIGGLVGYNTGNIASSSTGEADIDSPIPSGAVTGLKNVGGLVGFSSGNITISRATGDVNQITFGCTRPFGVDTPCFEYIGGLVGRSIGDITSSWASGNVGGQDYVGGLIGKSEGDITNSFASGYVGGNRYVGGLVGQSTGLITNGETYADKPLELGYVFGSRYVGGLVGYSVGNVSDSVSRVPVSGGRYVGGLVGYLEGDITNSIAEGEVDGGDTEVGGLVGYSEGDITGSSATGDVSGSGMGGPTDYIGGLVGYTTGDVTNSDASGDVEGGSYLGGLVGYTEGNVTNSHASGDVSSTVTREDIGNMWEQSSGGTLGGLVGYTTGNVTNSYAIGDVSSIATFSILDAIALDIFLGSGSKLGGLVGHTTGDITNSYAIGDVNSTVTLDILSTATTDPVSGYIGLSSGGYLGGLVGYSRGQAGYSAGSIMNSYATGQVNSAATLTIDSFITEPIDAYRYISAGSHVGGLVGSLLDNWSDYYGYYDELSALQANFPEGDNQIHSVLGQLFSWDSEASQWRQISFESLSALQAEYPEGNDEIYSIDGYLYSWDSDGSQWRKIFIITGSYATGDVTGDSNLGGLIGYLDSRKTITNSYATGNVIGAGEYIGGFIGDAGYISEISNSHATGAVTGTGEFEHGVGGFAGYLSGSLINTYATGNVNGFDEVGGLVGSTGIGVSVSITNSHATGNVSGDSDVGGLVGQLDINHEITNSYAKGNVTGDDDIGGLVGDLRNWARIINSYATGNVIGKVEDEGGDAGGLVGTARGYITNSHASGDVSGFYDVGGLVGDLEFSGEIKNSYARGNVRATGTDGDWFNGWGGLVGEVSGLIENSYATGNVSADYNAGALAGYWIFDELRPQIINSFATGVVTSANNSIVFDEDAENPTNWQQGLGGFVGCKELFDLETSRYFCDLSAQDFPETTPSLLSVVNTEGTAGAPAFEIVACKNNGLPLLSELSDSYGNTCAPVVPVTTNRERRIREFIQTTSMTEIAKTLGFVISPKFPNDAQIGFIKNEKDLAISKILGVQKAADRVARTFVKVGEALQISYDFGSKEPIELWVKLANGKWILAGVINFEKNGKAVLPPMYFKVAGEHMLVLNKPSEDSVKANAPLNQIGALTVIVN